MKPTQSAISRRALLILMAATAAHPQGAAAAALPQIVIHRDPNCGCCKSWGAHLARAGFPVRSVETQMLRSVKKRLLVPEALQYCHTAEVAGYIIEGHVPADAVLRLLAERPAVRGLAVPGMPVGSPGMEGGAPETYDVVAFGDGAQHVYARYKGARPL